MLAIGIFANQFIEVLIVRHRMRAGADDRHLAN